MKALTKPDPRTVFPNPYKPHDGCERKECVTGGYIRGYPVQDDGNIKSWSRIPVKACAYFRLTVHAFVCFCQKNQS